MSPDEYKKWRETQGLGRKAKIEEKRKEGDFEQTLFGGPIEPSLFGGPIEPRSLEQVAAEFEETADMSTEEYEAWLADKNNPIRGIKPLRFYYTFPRSFQVLEGEMLEIDYVIKFGKGIEIVGEPRVIPASTDQSECSYLADCGCTVTKGYRCPMHSHP